MRHYLETVIETTGDATLDKRTAELFAEKVAALKEEFDFGLLGVSTACVVSAKVGSRVRCNSPKASAKPTARKPRQRTLKAPAAPDAPAVEVKSPESPLAHLQGLSDCPYSVGDVLRYTATEGQSDWTVSEIVGDTIEIIPGNGVWALREYHNWRELEASPEWEIYKKAGEK